MTNDIEGKVRKELNSVYAKGRSRGVFGQGQEVIDSALSSILSLTTKADIDEKEVEKIVTEVMMPYYVVQGLRHEIAHAICSHFSKPKIKYPEKKILVSGEFMSRRNCEIKCYNQAIDDMRKLNGEGEI